MHRYCRLFLPYFPQFFRPFEAAQTLEKVGGSMSSGKVGQGEQTAVFCLFTAVFGLFPGAFPVWSGGGRKVTPRRNETPEKNFSKTAHILGSPAPQSFFSCHSTLAGVCCRKRRTLCSSASVFSIDFLLVSTKYFFIRLRFFSICSAVWFAFVAPFPHNCAALAA